MSHSDRSIDFFFFGAFVTSFYGVIDDSADVFLLFISLLVLLFIFSADFLEKEA